MRLRSVAPWLVFGSVLAAVPSSASADDFAAGSLIIPMDLDYQDEGMLRAYGLVYELLRNDVPVRWTIATGKAHGGVDFTASATDVATAAVITDHGYRGGPWVVDAGDAADAGPVIAAWQTEYPEVAVHEATDPFEAEVARYLVAAPTIAMVADGNQNIARRYMEAAAIPDSVLDYTWPDTSPDMLDVEELMGPTDTNHADGALFDEDGDPVYCQLMSMHWAISDAEDNPEVVAEVRQYLNNPTHFFAECQAVNAFENLAPHGFFLTPNGFEIADRPTDVDFYHADSPFGQMDGAYETVGGSEPAYTLPAGDMYKAGDITMVTEAGTPEGQSDVWMTGFLDGECPPDQHECGRYGKVSYLGGHDYSVDLPISSNPDTQGTRMFLNSLFEAPCATASGLPTLAVVVDAPEQTTDPNVTLELTYVNTGFTTALDAVIVDELPPGVTFVSASGGGMEAAGVVTWSLGNLGPGEAGDLEIEVELGDYGIYLNDAQLQYRVGLNALVLQSNESQTEYGDSFPETTSGGDSDSDAGTDTQGGGSASGTSSGTTTSTSGTSSDTATSGADADAGSGGMADGEDAGCGCRSSNRPVSGGWLLLALFGWVRRRRSKVVVAVAAAVGCTPPGPNTDTADGSGIDSMDATTGIDPSTSGGPMKLDVAIAEDTPFNPTTGCQKIDFLFVIDSSESMKDHQANLINSFPGFAEAIEVAVAADDWHVMVVDTDAQWGGAVCANACQTLGSCPEEPAFACDIEPPALCDITIGAGEVAPYGEGASNADCGLDPELRFIQAADANLPEAFACVAQVGVDGNSEERTADALVRAISPEMLEPDGCNEGFLRDDAILVVTIITDEPDEHSDGDPTAWHDALVAAKNGDEAAIVVLGLLPDADQAGALCETEEVAPSLGELVDSFSSHTRASVCAPDYSPSLAASVDLIATTCEDFVPPG